jgi:hypothetical protein
MDVALAMKPARSQVKCTVLPGEVAFQTPAAWWARIPPQMAAGAAAAGSWGKDRVMTNVHEFDVRDDDRDAEEKPPALPLTFFDDLSENPAAKPWLVKNVIARGETSSWIAPPGKGKSALLADLAVHNAAGKNWRGYRTKRRTGVVI